MITVAVAEGGVAKRRRHSSLDRLKRRSAAARWDELRQLWQPTAEDAQRPTQAIPAEASGEGNTVQEAAATPSTTVFESDASPPTMFPYESQGLRQDVVPVRVGQSATGSTTNVIPGLPALPPASATGRRTTSHPQQPVWYLTQDSKNDGRVKQTAAVEDVLPKPITDILPYYDYSPDGTDPCEFLCPRPEGCPAEDGSKPCPELVDLPDISLAGRNFVDTHVLWEPTNLFHNPLYFEDHALERYGHTHHPALQPLVSIGKFGVQLIGLPYQVALHPVCEHQYTLGWHRPGECVPYRYHLPPWNTKAAITAAGVYTGLIYLFP